MVQPNDLIVINDEYEAGSTLGFYLHRRDIHILHGHSANLWYGSFFSDAPHIFETDESFRFRWTGPQRVFLWVEEDKVPPYIRQSSYLLARSGGDEHGISAFCRESRQSWTQPVPGPLVAAPIGTPE